MPTPPFHNPDFVPSGVNNRANSYYQRINHVRIAREQSSRSAFYPPSGQQSNPPPPPPAPQAPPDQPWATDAEAEAWLDQFTTATGIGSPLDWSDTATLQEKHTAALQLWEDYTT